MRNDTYENVLVKELINHKMGVFVKRRHHQQAMLSFWGNCPDVFCEYVKHVDLKRKNYTDNWQKASLLNPKAQIIRVCKSSVLASLLRPIQHSLESFSNHNLSNKRHTTKLVFPQCRQGGTVSTEIIRLFHSSPHGSTFLVTSSAHTQRISH